MKILIWNMGRALGDGVMSTGYPAVIKKLYPNAQIDIFCTKIHSLAYFNNPYINNIFLFNTVNKNTNMPRIKIKMNPFAQLNNLKKAKLNQYDIIIDTSTVNSFFNRFMLKFIASKNTKIYGMVNPAKRNHRKSKKLLSFYTQLYDTCSYEIFDKDIFEKAKYQLFCSESCIDKANKYFSQYKKSSINKLIIFNGEGSARTISNEKIITTMKYLCEKFSNYHFFFLGYDKSYDKYNAILQQVNMPNLHITYNTSVEDTAALIQLADLLISVDTALIHIAAAVDTKVCEIVCSSSIKNYYPGTPRFVEYDLVVSHSEKYNLNNFEPIDVLNSINKLIS